MAAAEVGDDVYGDDPTVNRLQERSAEIFEKEAALFVPTGTMGNQIAVKLHTRPGQEIIIEERGHVFNSELGGPAVNSGVMVRPVKSGRRLGASHLGRDRGCSSHRPAILFFDDRPNLPREHAQFCRRQRNDPGAVRDVCHHAHALGLPVHMDGARIFNASVALETPVSELTRNCNSVQFCLSKGLGAPVGSVLLGSKDFIDEARIWRKRLGGGWRQAGILAAAGLVALEESPKRLHEDHQNARRLAEGLAEIPGIEIDPEKVATNIVIFDVSGTGKTGVGICSEVRDLGVLAIGFGSKIRMVTHCDISADDIETALLRIRTILV